ncbi:ABC transporter permease [Oceanobacillus jeddahense]|uniref:ABC transporter permease n=1 Tax=Oceanobacillus jeddahense TaxID=1462527 RepID=A0ABY5JRX1_9BACI|nr:ABC transporter permease [Oceanobacillus jeddahense]UUI03077.1 ABC transporter permease [Oceanobacillus jeddahense]
MSNLMMSEWYKLKRDRSFWTLILLLMMTSLFYPLLIVFDEGATTIKVIDFYRNTILEGNNYVIRLVPCILAGFFISSEYSIGTMKSITASGNSRAHIYFAKLIVYSIGAVLISLIFPLIFTGAVSVFLHFNGMPGIGYFAGTIGLTILYTIAFASMMALFATIFTDSGKAIGFMLIFFIIFDSILYLLGSLSPVFEIIYNYSVFKLFLDIGNIGTVHGAEMIQLVITPVVTFVAFGILGNYLFQKKEIK